MVGTGVGVPVGFCVRVAVAIRVAVAVGVTVGVGAHPPKVSASAAGTQYSPIGYKLTQHCSPVQCALQGGGAGWFVLSWHPPKNGAHWLGTH